MVQEIRRGLICLCLLASAAWGQRVFLFSFDGLGHQTLLQDPVARELKTLWQIREAGAMAAGLQPAFPSTTGNSHCALFTGVYGDQNNITGNGPPVLPRSGHLFTERGNGFRAEQLAAEPVWVTAARQGVPTVAHQVTQAIPFSPRNTHANAVVVNGYQTRSITPHTVIRETDIRPAGVDPRLLPLAKGDLAPKGFTYAVGPLEFIGAMLANGPHYDRIALLLNGSTEPPVIVPLLPTESEPPADRPLARRFAGPLQIAAPVPGALYFRLFELSPDGSRLLLYMSPLQELGLSNGKPLKAAGGHPAMIGNGASSLLQRGLFGNGEEAARRYLETVELCTAAQAAQAEALIDLYPARLFITYLPFPDEFDHAWLGLARQDPERYQPLRRWGYQVVERFMQLARRAAASDHVVFTSDHGMAAVTKSVAVQPILREAGLENAAGYFYNSILVNTTDWMKGTVPPGKRSEVVRQARESLARVRDPQSGQPVFTQFYTPEQDGGRFGIGGEAGGDLYFDLAPGYRAVSEHRGGGVIETLRTPAGVHGFMPLREDMLAILVARGPRLGANTSWPLLKSIQVTPLIAALLGIEPPPLARAPSPLAISSKPESTK